MQPLESWVENLKMVSFCPLCDSRYNPMEARVLGEEGDTHLLHVRCRKCANSILALVMANPAGVSSLGVVTDLSFEDVTRLKSAGRIGADDVIGAHQWLERGDWQRRLGRVRRPAADSAGHRRSGKNRAKAAT